MKLHTFAKAFVVAGTLAAGVAAYDAVKNRGFEVDQESYRTSVDDHGCTQYAIDVHAKGLDKLILLRDNLHYFGFKSIPDSILERSDEVRVLAKQSMREKNKRIPENVHLNIDRDLDHITAWTTKDPKFGFMITSESSPTGITVERRLYVPGMELY